MRPEKLDFIEVAPEVYVYESELVVERSRVFAAIVADPATWLWFPGVDSGSYGGSPPHGVGSARQVRMGGTIYDETIVAWEEPHRWGYRVDAASVPLAKAIVEEWVFEETGGGGTLVRWTFAIDPRSLWAAGRQAAKGVMGTLFRRAMANLDDHLRHAD